MRTVQRISSIFALLAVALWLGGLLALGALAAPVVFAMVPLPSSADTMVIVFRHFDVVAMSSAAVVLATEAARALARSRFARSQFTALDGVRVGASFAAALAAVVQATWISPRIAGLHAAGVIRGLGSEGAELSRMHDLAEWCGQAQVLVLAAVVVLHVFTLSGLTRLAASDGEGAAAVRVLRPR